MFRRIALTLDNLGLRPLVARLATLAYQGQTFTVDADGDWVHRQPGGTIYSPLPHTAPFAYFEHWVRDNWLHRYKLKPGDIVVDIGTGIGEEALVFSPRIEPGGLMLAIEAHPRVYRCLEKTARALPNVRPIHAAVAATDGEINIDDGSSILTGSVMGASGRPVPVFTLDTLTRDLPRIDFLRTNIAGAERLMLDGMAESVGKVRNACISCHDFLGRPETRSREAVVAFFRKHGFAVFDRPGTPAPMCDYIYAERWQANGN